MTKEKVNEKRIRCNDAVIAIQAVRGLMSWDEPEVLIQKMEDLFYHYCTNGDTELEKRQEFGMALSVLRDFLTQLGHVDNVYLRRFLEEFKAALLPEKKNKELVEN